MKAASRAWRIIGLCILALAAMPSGAAQARDNWGSIYFSPSTHANGFSYRHQTKSDAEWAAYENCDADDCTKAISFRNACGAVAVGHGDGWGSAWAPGGRQAQQRAIRACRNYTTGCRVIRWQCSG